MKRKGMKPIKNDIIVDFNGVAMNLTRGWDGTVDSFFEQDGKKVYFTAAVDGTKQLLK
jgi:hypothetical protein